MSAPPPFVRQVRHALAHLYDPDVLRVHPLLASLGLSERSNPQAALREGLLAAIESLKPAASVPVDSRAWRVYKVLTCRYAQQLDQEQTAHQLGVGVRHVRREQQAAVQVLADAVYKQRAVHDAPPAYGPQPGQDEAVSRLENELSWLKDSGQGDAVDAVEALAAALRLATPLAAMHKTRLELAAMPDLPAVAMHSTALRQALLSAVTCAIRRVPGGGVRCSGEQRSCNVLLRVEAIPSGRLSAPSEDECASLRAANAILSMEGGELTQSEERGSFWLTLSLPAAGAIDVLLIDDNADFAQLFGRYLAGTRYHVLWAPNADRAFTAISECKIHVIVQDIMIPGMDGWEILGRLRQHPLSSALPIIVCTILPERSLVMAMGATVFLPKPVTRQALLLALSQALGEAPPESR